MKRKEKMRMRNFSLSYGEKRGNGEEKGNEGERKKFSDQKKEKDESI